VSLFDLLFIVSFLATAWSLVRLSFLAVQGRLDRARTLAVRLGVFLGLYGAALVAVSLASPGTVVGLGRPQCFDEWCIAVTNVSREPAIGDARARGEFYVVTVRVSSRSRGRRQRERDVLPYLIDGAGRRFDVSPAGQEALRRTGRAGPGLTSFLDPGEAFDSRLAFDVPRDARDVAFVKTSRGWFPSLFVIGDPASFLHRPTRVPLAAS
jgi:hypothetical protein